MSASSASQSFLLKLERAREHLQSFDQEAKAWIGTEPYGIIEEPDPEPTPQPVADSYRPQRFRINRVSIVPPRLSILIGDCVFNLRAALDHLAMALARSFTPTMSDKQIIGSEFPIFGSVLMALHGWAG